MSKTETATNMSKTETATTMTTLAYYSGNFGLDCPATPGLWAGDVFTAADGSKWMVDHEDDSPHPATDGTDVHYLIPSR